MKLDAKQINFIAQEFKSGKTVPELAVELGMSPQNVKRALAEAGLMKLSWYKTNSEKLMLNYLAGMGIHNFTQLKEHL